MLETDKKPKMRSVEDVLKMLSQSKGDRANFEGTWQSVRDIFCPYQESVTGEETDGGELDFGKIFTDDPIEATRIFVAGLQTYLTPMNAKWITLRMRNKAVGEDEDVKKWIDEVEAELLYTMTNSNFNQAISEAFMQSALYGTTTMMMDSDEHDRVRYKTLPIKNVALVENARGQVAKFFIEEKFTFDQAVERWGEKALHRDMIAEAKGNKDSPMKYDFVYFVEERANRDKTKKDKNNMPIATQWIDVKNKHVVESGGFAEYAVASHRFYKRNSSAYGYGPCAMCLASARTLNKVASTNLRGGMKYADPALAVPSRGFLTKINSNPNAINVYQKDVNKDSIFTIPGGSGVPFSIEYEERLSNRMRRMMFNNVFQALTGITKEMTVPEVNQLVQEAMTQIGPAIGRFETEFLDKIVSRTLGILSRGGYLPMPPESILQDAAYEIEYTSYLSQMQKRGSIKTIYDAMGLIQQLAAFDPAVLDNFDVDVALKLGVEMQGLPATVLRGDVRVQEIRNARANAEMAQTQMGAMEQGARISNEVAGAASAMKGVA